MTPMTCDELDPIAREAARALAGADPGREGAGALDGATLLAVREHLRGCAACTRRLEGERRLDTAFARLLAREEPATLPPALERQLTAAFRERFAGTAPSASDPAAHAVSGPFAGGSRGPGDVVDLSKLAPRAAKQSGRAGGARRWPLFAGGLAIAAAAAAAVALLAGRPVDAPVAVGERPVLPLPADERPALPVVAPAGGSLQPGGVDEVIVLAGGEGARGAAFVPLGWDLAARPIEIGRVTRVRMPTAIAARFGWPLLPDAPDARVAADVLVGEDGTARALRFLPATYAPVSHTKE